MLAWGSSPLRHRRKDDLSSQGRVFLENDEVLDVAPGNCKLWVLFEDFSIRMYEGVETESDADSNASETTFAKEEAYIDVIAGGEQVFAIGKNNTAYAWGGNDKGQLGLGKKCSGTVNVPTALPLTKKVVQVSCGQKHTLLLTKYNGVYSMGDNSYGQLGMCKDLDVRVSEPRFVDSLKGVPIALIAAGGWHSFCVTVSGRVFAWGWNRNGQLGHGDTSDQKYPRLLSNFEHQVAFITAGDKHSVLITRKGGLFTFGSNLHGQLGHENSLESQTSPKEVAEFEGSVVTQVVCGSSHTVVYVTGCNQIFAFGNNEEGQLGLVGVGDLVTRPTIVEGPWRDNGQKAHKVERICGGGSQTYILLSKYPNKRPSDYRVIGNRRRIATLDEDLCERISKLDSDDPMHDCIIAELKCVVGSQVCVNGSFVCGGDSGLVNSDFHGTDFKKARLLMMEVFKSKNSAVMEAVFEGLSKTLFPDLMAEPRDIEALRLYITLPIILGCINDPLCMEDIFFPLLERLLALFENPRKVLKKWYKTLDQDNFLILIRFCKVAICEVLFAKRAAVTGIRMPLEFLQILYDVNASVKTVNYKEFYVPEISVLEILVAEYKKWRGRKKDEPSLCRYAFVLDARAKNMLMEINTRERLRITRECFLPITQLRIHRECMVTDALQRLERVEDLRRPLQVVFVGEDGIDDGALRKEFFMLVLQEIMQLAYLFRENDSSNLLWFSEYKPNTEQMYKLIGTICGMALYNNIIVNVNLPLALYKKLLGESPTLDDFKELDPIFGNSLQQVLDFEEEDDDTVEDVFSFVFTTCEGLPLKDGGADIAVTAENREEYVNLYLEHIFNKSVEKQFQSFREGFDKACEREILNLFRPEELMDMVVGIQDYDWEALKRSTRYYPLQPFGNVIGFDLQHPTIKWFWEVLLAMSRCEKEKFLLFLTGTNKIPLTGLHMKITQVKECDDFLPAADVCYNQLRLHSYSSKQILEERLKLAIQCKGFYRM